MTVPQAAKAWEEAKREIARLQPKLDTAAEVLKDHFRKPPDKRDYRGRIGYSVASRAQLDAARVKEELGDRLPEFQKTVTYETLSLLK